MATCTKISYEAHSITSAAGALIIHHGGYIRGAAAAVSQREASAKEQLPRSISSIVESQSQSSRPPRKRLTTRKKRCPTHSSTQIGWTYCTGKYTPGIALQILLLPFTVVCSTTLRWWRGWLNNTSATPLNFSCWATFKFFLCEAR